MEGDDTSLYICRLYISVCLAWSGELDNIAGYVYHVGFHV